MDESLGLKNRLTLWIMCAQEPSGEEALFAGREDAAVRVSLRLFMALTTIGAIAIREG